MKNTFQKIDIKDLAIVVGGSIYSSVGYGVGVVTHTVYDFGREIVGGNVAYDIGYGVGQVSYIAVEILKLRKIR